MALLPLPVPRAAPLPLPVLHTAPSPSLAPRVAPPLRPLSASFVDPARIYQRRARLVFSSDQTLCAPAHSRDEPPVHPPVAIHHDLCHIHPMVT